MRKIVVIGAGLIGTSIALGAKRSGYEVELIDQDGRAQALANDLLANSLGSSNSSNSSNSSDSSDSSSKSVARLVEPDLVVIATPTSALKVVLDRFSNLYPNSTFIDIGSTKTKVQLDIEGTPDLERRFCPTHPMAGRELDGAEAAQSDLFVGKSWVITPLSQTSEESIALAKNLIEDLGARVIEMEVREHDQAVALISHLPQIIASLLASQFSHLPNENRRYLDLAGSGVMDTTRIAASSSNLWVEILQLNREAVTELLKDFQKDLSTLIENFDVKKVLEEGRAGRHLLPGKHRSSTREYTFLPVVVDDKPNQLALLFNECAKADVNVEDIKIEHSPEQETGLVLLALSANNAKILQKHLLSAGWRVHPPRLEI